MANISFCGSHNTTLAVEIDGKIECVVEAERFCNYKNGAFAQYKLVSNPINSMIYVVDWIRNKYHIDEFDNCYYMNADNFYDGVRYELEKFIPAKKYIYKLHHNAHAAGTFYQSPYQEALIFSFDGGGNDGKFNIYHATRKNGIRLLTKVLNPLYQHAHIYYDLGFPYMILAHYMKDITQECESDGVLVYPGKLMGLASYGEVDENWLPFLIAFYKSNPDGWNYSNLINVLSMNINVELNINNKLEGEVAYNLAATSQRAFEECFLEVAMPYINQYPDLPVCITGGCGLNIILNTRLVTEFKKQVFVGPVPNDTGLAVGCILEELKPEVPVDITYAGIPILDIDTLPMYFHTYGDIAKVISSSENIRPLYETSINTIVQDLVDGRIIGVMRGNSEHGPRALGNRSILCTPTQEDMKNILNQKVKHREWYRPFAPVVRLEDVNKYFEWETESRWMSFCPKVREEWRDKLKAITHVDNTARIQTITKEQNPWLYELLTLLANQTGIGILLNTSFNVNTKPMLSTVSDAFEIFNKTQLDGLVIENYYFRKSGYGI